jgi:hypothetical protein
VPELVCAAALDPGTSDRYSTTYTAIAAVSAAVTMAVPSSLLAYPLIFLS